MNRNSYKFLHISHIIPLAKKVITLRNHDSYLNDVVTTLNIRETKLFDTKKLTRLMEIRSNTLQRSKLLRSLLVYVTYNFTIAIVRCAITYIRMRATCKLDDQVDDVKVVFRIELQ